MLAPWLLGFFPPHRTYVEPFGGGASVLLRKPRSYAEVYNDLDGEVVNLFRVLRAPDASAQLREAVTLTPFARAEFVLSYEAHADPVEQARRTLFRSHAGFGSGAASGHQTGFRNNVTRSGTTPAADWRALSDVLEAVADRLSGVVIEHRPAAQVCATFDGPDTLLYVDPPYPRHTRTQRGHYQGIYRHEMTDDGHRALAAILHDVRGMVVLSGYPCDLYDRELYAGWERHERAHLADGGRERTEVVWLNPACSASLRRERPQLDLIGGAA